MATKQSKTAENYFAQYKANKTWEKNRKIRLQRVLKQQPNNEQVKNALASMVYRRKTPGPHGWSATHKRIAQLYKEVTGLFSRDIFSPDPKVSQLALSRKLGLPESRNKVHDIPPSYGNSFFALGARLQGNWK